MRELGPTPEDGPNAEGRAGSTPDPGTTPSLTITEAPTIAPGAPLTGSVPSEVRASVHEDATIPPHRDPTIDLTPVEIGYVASVMRRGGRPQGFSRRQSPMERFGRSAVELLDKAAVGGLRNPDFFRSSNQLDPIGDREDFKGLVRRLESSTTPPK